MSNITTNTEINGVATVDIRKALHHAKDFIEDQLLDLTRFENGDITLEEFREVMNKKAEELDAKMEPLEALQSSEDE